MNLKDVMDSDIDDVFLDTDDFAKKHSIDDQEMLCIIDEDKSSNNKTDGVHTVRRRLFVKQTSMGYRPVPEQKMKIDNQYWYVVDCVGEGLIEVVLEAREA
jgi:hypothetical protein